MGRHFNLKEVPVCRKPACDTASGIIHRHHKRCEAMFVRHFRAKRGTKRYKQFVRRYNAFHPLDVVHICDSHHQEIHEIYMVTIRRECRMLRKSLWEFTWTEAEVLMDKLAAVCDRWLKRKTKGSTWQPRR